MLNWIAPRELSPSRLLRFHTGWADFILQHNCISCRFIVRIGAMNVRYRTDDIQFHR